MIIQKIQNTNIIIQNKTEKNSKSHNSCLPHNPPPHTSQFTFPKKHIITNTLVSFTESLCVSLPSQKSLFPNKQITKILESTDMALGLPSSCPTRLHACPSSFFFFFLKKMRDMAGCNMVSAKKTNENLKHTSHAD